MSVARHSAPWPPDRLPLSPGAAGLPAKPGGARPFRSGGASPLAKRATDATAALAGLAVLLPLFAAIGLAIRLDSGGPVFFRQWRVGRHGRPFRIWKFRTMVTDAPQRGPGITFGADRRITRVGRVLRRTKLDELPQLVNVLTGDMSLVGPRPEIPRYVEMFLPEYRELLEVRPGITDLASLAYMNEAELLDRAADPELEYAMHTLPAKLHLSRIGLASSSWRFDARVVIATVAGVGRASLLSKATWRDSGGMPGL